MIDVSNKRMADWNIAAELAKEEGTYAQIADRYSINKHWVSKAVSAYKTWSDYPFDVISNFSITHAYNGHRLSQRIGKVKAFEAMTSMSESELSAKASNPFYEPRVSMAKLSYSVAEMWSNEQEVWNSIYLSTTGQQMSNDRFFETILHLISEISEETKENIIKAYWT